MSLQNRINVETKKLQTLIKKYPKPISGNRFHSNHKSQYNKQRAILYLTKIKQLKVQKKKLNNIRRTTRTLQQAQTPGKFVKQRRPINPIRNLPSPPTHNPYLGPKVGKRKKSKPRSLKKRK